MDQLKRVGQFECHTRNRIGQGFSSNVYKGVDTTSGVPVIFKVIDNNTVSTDVMQYLLKNELRALQIMDHPYVLSTFVTQRTPKETLMVCEYCPGGDLMHDIQRSGGFPEKQALDLLTQMASGVNYIHSLGILHRDLKTSNILITQDGTVKITDFGFCDFVKERPPGYKLINVGSPLYMSPQAYKSNEYSTKSDSWGLGVILYQMLIGRTPFLGLNYDGMVQNVRNGTLIRNLRVSDYCKKILFGLLQVETRQRWETTRLLTQLSKSESPPICCWNTQGFSSRVGPQRRDQGPDPFCGFI